MVESESARSNSSLRSISLGDKIRYNWELLRFRMSEPGARDFANGIYDEIADVAATFERETGRPASGASVVEIGFGPRPQRAFALSCFFGTVTAVDLDAPVLGFRDLPGVFRRNGLERGIKSLIRHTLFDARAWSRFHRTLRARNPHYRPEAVRLVVGNAGAEDTWDQIGPVDLVFSTDVFEHIPVPDLEWLLQTIRAKLPPNGIVLTKPVVYTGIAGGHAVRWYPQNVASQTDGTTAWRHLLDPDFSINTYLNKLGRRDFVALFRRTGFDVAGDHAEFGRLGERWMTAEKRRALSAFDDYELFSNRVAFLLR